MTLENHIPPAPLDTYIESIIYFRDLPLKHSKERLVPTGNVFLVFELDGFTRYTFDNDTLEPNASFTGSWVSGMHRHCISISAHENSEMLAVQFKPAGAFPFLPFDLSQLNEKILPATKVFGNEMEGLRQSMIQAQGPAEKFACIEKWLLSKLDQNKKIPAELTNFISQLQLEPVSSLNQLASSYPHTQKQLITHFNRYVGIGPKYYQRIIRFNELLQKIHRQEKISWASIAYDCGYADQSHFIREFRHFSGFNPSEFIERSMQSETNFFPLDRKG